MQAAKRLKCTYTARDILEYCNNWKTVEALRKDNYDAYNNDPISKCLAKYDLDEQIETFCYMMKSADFEHDTVADLCAILKWLHSAAKEEVFFPLWIYYKATPPEDQTTFFRRWVYSRKGPWPDKWNEFFDFVDFKPTDNPAILWLAMFEMLKFQRERTWKPLAKSISPLLTQFKNMPKFTSKELSIPKPRYHYFWNIKKVQQHQGLQFPLARRWHDDPAEMVLHERKCKYLIIYLIVVGEAMAPVAESIYFSFPPVTKAIPSWQSAFFVGPQ